MEFHNELIIPNVHEQDMHKHDTNIPRTSPLKLFLPIWLLLLGLSAYFLWSGKMRTSSELSQVESTIVPTTVPHLFFLSLASKGNVTSVDGELVVSGRTLPNTPVVIYSEDDETSVESDGQGNFEGSVYVGEDGGLVQVIAYNDNGEQQEETLEIQPKQGVSVLGEHDARGQVRKNTQEQVLPGKPDFVLDRQQIVRSKSEVTSDLATDFLQNRISERTERKLGAARIREMLSDGATNSAKTRGRSLVAMDAKEASRGARLSRHAVMGVITELAPGVITLSHQVQRELVSVVLYNASTIFSVKGITNASAANLAVGMRITAVGLRSEEGLLAKLVHVIPGNATGVFNKAPVATVSATTFPTSTPIEEASPTATISE